MVAVMAVSQPWSALSTATATPAAATTTAPNPASSPSAAMAPASATASAPEAPTPTPTRVKPLAAPKGLKITSMDESQVTMAWQAVDEAPAYLVRYASAKSMSKAKTLVVKEPTATLMVPNSTRLYAQVTAATAKGAPLGRYSKVLRFAVAPLDVASYNIHCSSCHKSGKLSWPARRANVVKIITQENPDVLGLQEALTTRNQIGQLVSSLGGRYRLVPAPGVKDGSRIIYRPEAVRLIKSGTTKLPGSGFRRFASWAIFEQHLTGQRFFFLSTHLEPGSSEGGLRNSQTSALISSIRANAGSLPVYAVGDFNAYKFDSYGNRPWYLMKDAGYLDPLGNTFRSHGSAPGAFVEQRINTNYDTSNRFEASPPKKSYINGSHLDYIFVTEGIRVPEFEVVVRVGASGRWTMSPIPSDHNMVRATTFLPTT